MPAVAEKIKLKPLGSRVVIKALDREETTKSGIFLPDTAKEKPMEGRVLAVGPGDRDEDGKRVPVELKEGERVLYQTRGVILTSATLSTAGSFEFIEKRLGIDFPPQVPGGIVRPERVGVVVLEPVQQTPVREAVLDLR